MELSARDVMILLHICHTEQFIVKGLSGLFNRAAAAAAAVAVTIQWARTKVLHRSVRLPARSNTKIDLW